MRGRTIRTAQKQTFVLALAAGHSVTAAAREAKVSRSAVYGLKDTDSLFSEQWDSAVEESVDLLEDECRRRALQQSDLLMIFLLRHRRPNVYRPSPRTAPAMLALSSEDVSALESVRRIRSMTDQEIEEECREIERRRRLADEARAMADAIPPHRGNGHGP
jgi:hypothetical protein